MSIVGKWFGFGQDEIYEEGLVAFERGDYEEAMDAFRTCLNEGSDPAMLRLAKHYLCESHYHAGNDALRAGNYRLAADNFGQAIALSPNYADLHFSHSRAYHGLGDRKRELQELDHALDLNPGYVDALLAKGALLYETGEHELGLSLIEKAAARDQELFNEAYREALAFHRSNDFERAGYILKTLRKHDSDGANDYARKAERATRALDLKTAKKAYEMALAEAPGYADLHCRYGKVLLELGEIEEAAEELRKAIDINDRYVDALANLGVAFAKLNRDLEAGDCFARALVLDPYHPVALSEAGRVPSRRSSR